MHYFSIFIFYFTFVWGFGVLGFGNPPADPVSRLLTQNILVLFIWSKRFDSSMFSDRLPEIPKVVIYFRPFLSFVTVLVQV
jgi:hypothetical protein